MGPGGDLLVSTVQPSFPTEQGGLIEELERSFVGEGEDSTAQRVGERCLRQGSSSGSLEWVRRWRGSRSCTSGSVCRPEAPLLIFPSLSALVGWNGTSLTEF